MTDPINAALDRLQEYAAAHPEHDTDELVARARAALAKPADAPAAGAKRPSDDELGLIYHDCCGGCEFMDQGGFEDAARVLLARWGQPPAPPAGGEVAEPVSVTGQPSDQEGPSAEDVEELCEEHCFNVEGYESIECLQGLINEAIARWGNRQGSLDSSSSAKGEVAELVAWLRENAEDERQMSRGDNLASLKLDHAAELLERHAAPVPVPVAERLPGPEDCDTEGKCWLLGKVEGDWRLINPAESGVPLRYCFSHWLPASALPLPALGGEVEP